MNDVAEQVRELYARLSRAEAERDRLRERVMDVLRIIPVAKDAPGLAETIQHALRQALEGGE